MEVVMGALPSILRKLAELAAGEYNLQKGLKGEIMLLQQELESIKRALKNISDVHPNQLSDNDKIWARNVTEMSYDMEDKIDTFIVQCNGGKEVKHQGLKKVIDRSLDLLMQPMIRHKLASEIRDIKSRLMEEHNRRHRYTVPVVRMPPTVDPRLLSPQLEARELVGIDRPRDEVIKILQQGNERSKQRGRILSIVGFGGLGKTTLANVVYDELKQKFDCSAFVSVSQTPDADKLLKNILRQLDKTTYANINGQSSWGVTDLIQELRVLLQGKRYFIVIDDIWDISSWRLVKGALPDNNVGYTIMTTTRILSVAEQIGDVYKLETLPHCASRKLLFGIIFGNENQGECPDKQLLEVSEKILKKCGGVPLAITTIASLLARKGKNKIDWYEVCNSIGSGVENSQDMNNTRMILSLSCYELPSHLRACLLYLSVFPEDSVIDKGRLIRMWIAEGFVQYEENGKKSLLELGESYFNDLISRSLIQPDFSKYGISGCRLHDILLDMLRSYSCAENFVTILNHMDLTTPAKTVRRLCLTGGHLDHACSDAGSMQKVRSVIAISSSVNQLPTHGSFRVLRVLDVQGCVLSRGISLNYVGKLLHLRYLGLRGTGIDELPEEVGKLEFLETLDVMFNDIYDLPTTIVQLRHLMCLHIDTHTRVPKGIRSLTSLEELSYIGIHESTRIIEELGYLTELKQLFIAFSNTDNLESTNISKQFVECLCKLHKIQMLQVDVHKGQLITGNLDGWVGPPQHIRQLRIRKFCWFSKMPAWMNGSHLINLTVLEISIRVVKQEDLESLGTLQVLCYLELNVDHVNLAITERLVFGAYSFPSLGFCYLEGFVGPLVFQQGAMPRLDTISFPFSVREAIEINGSFDTGLGNLQSVRNVFIELQSEGASKEELKDAFDSIWHTLEIHPNVRKWSIDHPDFEDSDDESLAGEDGDSDDESCNVEDQGALAPIFPLCCSLFYLLPFLSIPNSRCFGLIQTLNPVTTMMMIRVMNRWLMKMEMTSHATLKTKMLIPVATRMKLQMMNHVPKKKKKKIELSPMDIISQLPGMLSINLSSKKIPASSTTPSCSTSVTTTASSTTAPCTTSPSTNVLFTTTLSTTSLSTTTPSATPCSIASPTTSPRATTVTSTTALSLTTPSTTTSSTTASSTAALSASASSTTASLAPRDLVEHDLASHHTSVAASTTILPHTTSQCSTSLLLLHIVIPNLIVNCHVQHRINLCDVMLHIVMHYIVESNCKILTT